jgi:hypothetical protein
MLDMHAEAVKHGSMPSKPGLNHDNGHVITCGECCVQYHLYYDREAEPSFTFCSILATEIITARHPDHHSNIVLELSVLRREPPLTGQGAWFVRPGSANLERKPYLIHDNNAPCSSTLPRKSFP